MRRQKRMRLGGTAFLLAALAALALTGCTYTAHRYLTEQPLAGSGDWEVYGDISRRRPADESSIGSYPPATGRARKDDEYRLTLSPVPKDAGLWSEFGAELVNPRIVAGGSIIDLEWAEVVDARVDSLDLGYTESYVEYRKTRAPLSYESAVFRLPVPPPDSLLISAALIVRRIGTGEESARIPVSVWVIKESHRRLSIRDALEL